MKKILCLVFFSLGFLISNCFSQQNKIDSLLVLLKTDKTDTVKLLHLIRLSRLYDNTASYDSALIYANSALQLINVTLKNSAEPSVKRAAQKGKAGAYNSIGIVYLDQGNYPEALKNYFTSLKINEEINDRNGIAAAYNNIGLVYSEQRNSEEALKNYETGLKIYIEIDNKRGIASAYNNIGLIYAAKRNYPEALKNYLAALKIRETIDDKKGLAYSFNNLGLVYFEQRDYEDALKNHLASLKIREALGDKAGIAGSNCNIGLVFTKLKKYMEAENYLNKAKEVSKKIGQREFLRKTYKALALLDSARGNFSGAFENQKLYGLYGDSLDNEETQRETIQNQMNYDFEKKEAATKAEQDKKELIRSSDAKKQKIILCFTIFGLLAALLFAGFIFRSLRLTRKQKEIIERQKNLVDEKQKEILDSIHYAKRIQMALLTGEKYIGRNLKKLNKP